MDTCPFLGPLIPLFWNSDDVFSWFESQSGFCLICFFCRGKCNIHSQRSTSGATHANLLVASTQLVTSPHACAEVGLGLGSNRQSPRQNTNALPLCQQSSQNGEILYFILTSPRVLHYLFSHQLLTCTALFLIFVTLFVAF